MLKYDDDLNNNKDYPPNVAAYCTKSHNKSIVW